jgi:hypothetical protein
MPTRVLKGGSRLAQLARLFGLVAAASLFLNLFETIGVDMGPMITVSVTLLHFWMLAAALVFWRKK